MKALICSLFSLWLSFAYTEALAPDYNVVGVGTACMDVLIAVDDEFLAKNVPGEPGGCFPLSQEILEKILGASPSKPTMVLGGSSANTIRGLAKLGEKCALISYVGPDEFGKKVIENLQELHITNKVSQLEDCTTGWALCMISPDGQRTIRYLDRKSMGTLPVPDDFKNVDLVYIEAYRLRHGDFVEKVMEMAQREKCQIALNLGSTEIVGRYKERILNITSCYVDLIFSNEDEIRALTDLSPEEGCLQLQKICPIVVVTQGAKDCLVGHRGKVLKIPAFETTVLDTTGAGDLFASGFLYGYRQNFPLEQCAELGHHLGSAIIQVMGAELPEERWEKLRSVTRDLLIRQRPEMNTAKSCSSGPL